MEQTMKILITGKNGFIARNAISYFKDRCEVLAISHEDRDDILNHACQNCDIVLHFAAVQRSEREEDFWSGNVEYTKKIVECLEKNVKKVPIIFSTSIGIDKPSVFATTKKIAEQLIRDYSKKQSVPVYVFKLNHIFGKWGKPDFNNVIATFCNNIVNSRPIVINNPATTLDFTYIDDLMADLDRFVMCDKRCMKVDDAYMETSIRYSRTLGEVVMSLGNALNGKEPKDEFEKKLFVTLDSYYEK